MEPHFLCLGTILGSRHFYEKFLRKILTPLEYEYCRSKVGLAPSVAARFAVKEAVYKALPTSVQPRSAWLDIEVENDKVKVYKKY